MWLKLVFSRVSDDNFSPPSTEEKQLCMMNNLQSPLKILTSLFSAEREVVFFSLSAELMLCWTCHIFRSRRGQHLTVVVLDEVDVHCG